MTRDRKFSDLKIIAVLRREVALSRLSARMAGLRSAESRLADLADAWRQSAPEADPVTACLAEAYRAGLVTAVAEAQCAVVERRSEVIEAHAVATRAFGQAHAVVRLAARRRARAARAG